jgi:hypothetical protein
MAQLVATVFLLSVLAGVAKMVFDVQMAKLNRTLKHLLK